MGRLDSGRCGREGRGRGGGGWKLGGNSWGGGGQEEREGSTVRIGVRTSGVVVANRINSLQLFVSTKHTLQALIFCVAYTKCVATLRHDRIY